MVSGSFDVDLASDLREAVEASRHDGEVRFEQGEERPLGRKGRRTRARILLGARQAFLERGWSAATMATIAERAEVGAGTIYQYFRAKEDVLAALVHEWTLAALGQLRAWDPADGQEGLRSLVARFVRGYASTAALQRVWEEASLTEAPLAALRSDLTEVYVRTFAEAFARGEEAGLLHAGPRPVETARALCAMVDRYCQQTFGPGRDRAEASVDDTEVEDAVDLLTGLWSAALDLT